MSIKKRSELAKLARHDLTVGVFYAWKKYIGTILLFTVACGFLLAIVNMMTRAGKIHSQPTLLDYLVFVFEGAEPYVPGSGREFHLPAIWLAIQLYLAFTLGGYPLNDLTGYGKDILVRSKRRGLWWGGKCLWCVAGVLVFYAIGYVVAFLFALCTGSVSLVPGAEICMNECGFNSAGISPGALLFGVTVLPILTSIALSLLQMTLSFLLRPVYSYMIIATLLALSSYFCTPWLLGNHSMLLRSAVVLPGGIEPWLSLVFCVAVAAIAVVVGNGWFKKFDILDKA